MKNLVLSFLAIMAVSFAYAEPSAEADSSSNDVTASSEADSSRSDDVAVSSPNDGDDR